MSKRSLMYLVGVINIIFILLAANLTFYKINISLYAGGTTTGDVSRSIAGDFINHVAIATILLIVVSLVLVKIGFLEKEADKRNLPSILLFSVFIIFLFCTIYFFDVVEPRLLAESLKGIQGDITYSKGFAYYSIIISCILSLINGIIPFKYNQ